jgi:hypothetical protein
VSIFTDGAVAGGFSEGIARVTAVILASPQFLYRIEVGGDPSSDVPDAVMLTSHELATRLAYLFGELEQRMFGIQRPTLDQATVSNVEFDIPPSAPVFDIWIDDIALYH